ncbi:MAG: MmcQ/YjbR family DNA-binding protein [Acidimicrobiia bacterium]|nr:MmcQ/YjbR family DNA-binding protein [Acidimicrobiia bacterium]
MSAAEPSYPFGPGAQVWKGGGKIFAIVSEDSEPVQISLKCDPELALDLREEFPGRVRPGYHLNKRHWNTVVVDQLPDGELEDWIGHSYELVVASLPARIRQVISKP